MELPRLHGIVPPLPTPLNADETIDRDALVSLVESHLRAGVHGLWVLGTRIWRRSPPLGIAATTGHAGCKTWVMLDEPLPTSGLVALMFGTRWMAMLFGIAFFSHQLGGFLGVWLGGLVYERTGSYDIVWWLSVLFGILSALINLPIVEKPVARPVLAPA